MLTRPTVRTVVADLARPIADSANFWAGLLAAVGKVLYGALASLSPEVEGIV